MPEFDYRCSSCGTVTSVSVVREDQWAGDEYPPEGVKSICAEAQGGCGEVEELEHAGDGTTATSTSEQSTQPEPEPEPQPDPDPAAEPDDQLDRIEAKLDRLLERV